MKKYKRKNKGGIIMENASKALIIAGAILLAIVIISLGLIVVNNTRGTADTANLNEQDVQTYNSKFTPYGGTKVSGTRVKSLIETAIASNQANSGNSDKHVKIGTKEPTSVDTTEYTSGKTYTVTFEYNDKSLINKINIAVNP